MPIYEFSCQDCNARFEQLILTQEGLPFVICPKCESRNVEKMMSPFSTSSSDKEPGASGMRDAGCGPRPFR
jgi:putative FmdB family regulatory protein